MDRRPRPFGLNDAMLLIGALALGFGGMRSLWYHRAFLPDLNPGRSISSLMFPPARLLVGVMLAAVAAPLTAACLACRLRRPRPAWRRAATQPGTAAALACCVAFAGRSIEAAGAFAAPKSIWSDTIVRIRLSDATDMFLVVKGLGNGISSLSDVAGYTSVVVASFGTPAGFAVAATWAVLAASGRWRPEKSWIDRLGRALGLTWIGITALESFPRF